MPINGKLQMTESELEKRLMLMVSRHGGIALKFTSPSYSGMPDRLILFPDSKVGFVEVKRFGKRPTAVQLTRLDMLKTLGFKVFVLDQPEDIERIIDEILSA